MLTSMAISEIQWRNDESENNGWRDLKMAALGSSVKCRRRNEMSAAIWLWLA